MARPLRIEYPAWCVLSCDQPGGMTRKMFKNKAREVAIYIARDMIGITCKDLGEYLKFKM
jgi:hypothetical protein